jgi:two-component system response regulator YesN
VKKVFIIDDEPDLRETMRDRIEWEKLGCIFCGEASDGELALPLIELLKPDIVVSDIMMPFMDGLELSRLLKIKIPTVKIILISGHDQFHFALKALRIGVSEYCLKPISPLELSDVIRQVALEIDAQTLQSHSMSESMNTSRKYVGLSMQKLIDIDRSGMMQFMKFGETEHAFDFTSKYMGGFEIIDWDRSFLGSYVCMELALAVIQFCKEAGGGEAVSTQEIGKLEQKINDVRSYDEAVHFIAGLLESVIQFRQQANNKYAVKMNKAKDYIRDHYARYDLSLQLVAEHIGMSPSYFSTIFSQEAGQTFVEFLTEVRMRNAKDLMQTTDYKTYEIAFKVGYNDAHYFSFLFKKFTGKTTREFRKMDKVNAVH